MRVSRSKPKVFSSLIMTHSSRIYSSLFVIALLATVLVRVTFSASIPMSSWNRGGGEEEEEANYPYRRHQDDWRSSQYSDLLSVYDTELEDDGRPSSGTGIRKSRWALPAGGVRDTVIICPPGHRRHSSGTYCIAEDEEY